MSNFAPWAVAHHLAELDRRSRADVPAGRITGDMAAARVARKLLRDDVAGHIDLAHRPLDLDFFISQTSAPYIARHWNETAPPVDAEPLRIAVYGAASRTVYAPRHRKEES